MDRDDVRGPTARRLWAGARLGGGLAILGFVFWQLGTGPFLAGLRTVHFWSVAAAVGIAVITTVGAAWRWSLVARGLGAPIDLRSAIRAYYRSQFLNTVLPGGVLGDVDRAVRHGGDVGHLSRGVRSVAWERAAGQVVQLGLTLIVLSSLASPVPRWVPMIVATVLASAVVVPFLRPREDRRVGLRQAQASVVRAQASVVRAQASVVRAQASVVRAQATVVRAHATLVRDLRAGVLGRRSWPGIVLASTVVVAGHVATFVLAARTAGVGAPTGQLVPLALLVLLAMAVPTNIGGWGPREGAAAALFAAAGLGAEQGLATATVYGVLVFAATLPGAVVPLLAGLQRLRSHPRRRPRTEAEPTPVSTSGAVLY